ncbi:MAG: hypothetical protein QME45_02085 [Clostridiales bacterium]|nr:hypothetical protein [Clostridiales bacterium]
MNISIEKALHKGLDGIEVQPWLESQTIRKITEKSKITLFDFRSKTKYVSVAACVLAFIIAFTSIQPYPDNKRFIESESGLNQPSKQTPASSKTDVTGQSGAVYHNIDISQIVRHGYDSDAKVPVSFYFSGWLMSAGKELDIGRHWHQQAQFTKDDIESSLHTYIIDPVLPDGDYTMTKAVLKDDATDEIMAYQTVYYYFNKDTMEFQNRFSIFYFAEDHFDTEKIEQMQNVTRTEGKIHIDDFSQEANVHIKIPHVRKLVYMENGVGIAIEAETDAVIIGGKVDRGKSLERYEQTDKQLIALMKSVFEK